MINLPSFIQVDTGFGDPSIEYATDFIFIRMGEFIGAPSRAIINRKEEIGESRRGWSALVQYAD